MIFSDKFQQSKSYMFSKVPQLLEVPVVIPQVQFLDKFDTPVVCNDRCRGPWRDSAGAVHLQGVDDPVVQVVAWFVQFLDKFVNMPVVVQIFDTVALCRLGRCPDVQKTVVLHSCSSRTR